MNGPFVGDEFVYLAPMAPFPKARPRVTRNGTFMPDKYQAARKELQTYCGDLPDLSGVQIGLSVVNVRPMPKSWSEKKKEAMNCQWCSAGPDADNAAGAVMDALLEDDSCVVELVSSKVWGREAAIEIKIEVLSTDPVPF